MIWSAERVPEREELSDVRAAHRFDEQALESYLANVLPGFEGPLSIKQFSGGQSNPTFLLSTGDTAYVLRKKPPGNLLPSAHAVDREFRVLAALGGSELPVPRVFCYCSDEQVIGTPFYVMEHLEGRVFRNPLLPDAEPQERAAIYDSMNHTLAQLHKVNWMAAGMDDFGRPENYIARQIAVWTRQYEASKTDDCTAMTELMHWLPENMPDDQSSSIVHGDFRLENLIFHPSEPRVIGVLDWELSTLGHPLSDLAFNCMTYYLSADSVLARGFLGQDIGELGIPSQDEYVRAYCERTGRPEIRDWTYFMAFSLFRTAAIQQGIYARALKGNASSERAREFGKLFSIVAERGWALVNKA
jgi:aminoglycoside phosphotransferase (APT) family kinase protein